MFQLPVLVPLRVLRTLRRGNEEPGSSPDRSLQNFCASVLVGISLNVRRSSIMSQWPLRVSSLRGFQEYFGKALIFIVELMALKTNLLWRGDPTTSFSGLTPLTHNMGYLPHVSLQGYNGSYTSTIEDLSSIDHDPTYDQVVTLVTTFYDFQLKTQSIQSIPQSIHSSSTHSISTSIHYLITNDNISHSSSDSNHPSTSSNHPFHNVSNVDSSSDSIEESNLDLSNLITSNVERCVKHPSDKRSDG
jgi:hypothetical protein